MISFADISHHQAGVDLAAYTRAGHDRIILKATEGVGYRDPTFIPRWRLAGQLGLARVAYHYARTRFDGADEFDSLLAAVTAAGGVGPRDWLCLDAEDTADPAGAAVNAAQFTRRATARGYPNGLLYTGVWYANPWRVTAGVLQPGWRRLWLSNYTASTPDASMTLPNGWTRDMVAARQFTDRAAVPGVAGGCDYNRVLQDWLSTPQEEADMTPEEHGWLEDIHAQIGGAVGAGQTTFAGTVRATLGTVQAVVNLSRAQSSALGAAISKTETSVLAAVATLPTDHLTPADRAELASSVAGLLNEQGIHVDGEALLDALAARLTADPVHG